MKKEWQVKKMKLEDLKPASYNPRKMSVEAYQGLGKSMEQFGLLIPIVWNQKTGNIVGGHQRFRHLMEKGEKETEVVVVDLNDNEEVALNIALNNRFIRGDFTKEVMTSLKMSEVQLGSVFNDVGLADLLNKMGKVKWERDPKKPKEDKPEPTVVPTPVRKISEMSTDPDAIITCPKCQSRWKMKNNEVVHNAINQ